MRHQQDRARLKAEFPRFPLGYIRAEWPPRAHAPDAQDSRIYLGKVLGGERIGLKELEDDCWLITFGQRDLAIVRHGTDKITRIAEETQGAEQT